METFQVEAQTRACGTCANMYKEHIQGQIQRIMVCHEGPPAVFMMQTPRGIQGVTQFPIVQLNMFCHRYKAVDVAQSEPQNVSTLQRPLELSAQLEKPSASAKSDDIPPAANDLMVPDGT